MFNYSQIAQLTNGTWLREPIDSAAEVNGLSIDSRSISTEQIFLALQGENFDGHDFVNRITASSIKLVIVSRELDSYNFPTLLVPDCKKAIALMAGYFCANFKGKIITVTGSNGKTSFQNWLSQVLSNNFKVHSPKSSFNNLIGVSHTILNCPDAADFLILELGTNNPGEILPLALLAQAHYAVLLNVGFAHSANFLAIDAVYAEKLQIFSHLRQPKIGLTPLADTKIIAPVTINAEHFANEVKAVSLNTQNISTILDIDLRGRIHSVECSLIGAHLNHTLSALVKLLMLLELTDEQILQGISMLKPKAGRMQVYRHNDNLIIDDSYNANPSSILSLILSIKQFEIAAKYLIIGPVAETRFSPAQITPIVSALSISKIQTLGFGNLAEILAEDSANLNVTLFASKEELIKGLAKYKAEQALYAFKASRSARFEDVVAGFTGA